MEVRFSKQAQKDMQRIPKEFRRLIREAIDGLKQDPPMGDIKILKGFSDGRKRLRVGKYRIVYQYRDNGKIYIWVIEVGCRGDIYK